MNARVVIDTVAGRLTVGRVRLSLTAHATPGGLRVGADGPVLRPLTFAERSRLAAQAATTAQPADNLAEAVCRAATVEPGEPLNDLAAWACRALALALAGADGDAPPFAETMLLLARQSGWSLEQIDGAEAARVDWLVQRLTPAAAVNDGWTQLVFDGTASADDDPAAIGRELAHRLLERYGAPVPRAVEPEPARGAAAEGTASSDTEPPLGEALDSPAPAPLVEPTLAPPQPAEATHAQPLEGVRARLLSSSLAPSAEADSPRLEPRAAPAPPASSTRPLATSAEAPPATAPVPPAPAAAIGAGVSTAAPTAPAPAEATWPSSTPAPPPASAPDPTAPAVSSPADFTGTAAADLVSVGSSTSTGSAAWPTAAWPAPTVARPPRSAAPTPAVAPVSRAPEAVPPAAPSLDDVAEALAWQLEAEADWRGWDRLAGRA